jgi:hypothetical protein
VVGRIVGQDLARIVGKGDARDLRVLRVRQIRREALQAAQLLAAALRRRREKEVRLGGR